MSTLLRATSLLVAFAAAAHAQMTPDAPIRYGMFIMWRHIALHDLHHANKIEDRLLRKTWE